MKPTNPAAAKLTVYLAQHGIPATKFANDCDINLFRLRRIMRGDTHRVSVVDAVRIHRATGGVVSVGLWADEGAATESTRDDAA